MPNTTVTIKYSNGDEREFIASDKLEEMINNGEMFSVTTMHSDMCVDEEVQLSKMYVGNPMSALGNMMMMRKNAEGLLKEDESMNTVIETLNASITLLSSEIISHQSGMTVPEVLDEGLIRHGNEVVRVVPELTVNSCYGCMYNSGDDCKLEVCNELLSKCVNEKVIYQPVEKH